MVVNELLGNESSSSVLGNIFQNIKRLMIRFQFCNIQFSHRQYNVVTHSLAKIAWHVDHIAIWFVVMSSSYSKPYGLIKDIACLINFDRMKPICLSKKKKCSQCSKKWEKKGLLPMLALLKIPVSFGSNRIGCPISLLTSLAALPSLGWPNNSNRQMILLHQ